MNAKEREDLERRFLDYCGFDLSKGWWDEDYQYYRRRNPEEHKLLFGCK